MMLVLMQALNVVLTHTTADFDTLAAAVGLAKLWQDERPDDGKSTKTKKEAKAPQRTGQVLHEVYR